LAWFVHPEHGSRYALAFIRDHKSGAYVFGGHTGSHYTGHGERWTKKLAEIERLGYLPLPVARSRRVVPQGWQPPEQEAERDVVVARIKAGEL
jgi:hypothetical protein